MDETPKAAAAYAEYEAMGVSRSLAKLAEKLGQNEGKARARLATLEQWSAEHHWQERVKAYDLAQIEAKRLKREAEIEAMNERHAQIGVTLQAKALKQIEALITAQKFGSQATVQALKLATDLERLARGEATEHTEVSGKVGVNIYLPEKQTLPEGHSNGDSES